MKFRTKAGPRGRPATVQVGDTVYDIVGGRGAMPRAASSNDSRMSGS